MNRFLSERDIRPQFSQLALREAVAADREFLLARQNRFVAVNCPACGEKGHPLFDKLCIHYEKCPSCRTVFVNPRPSESLLHEFYAQSRNYANWNKYIFPASETARRQNIFAPRAKRLRDICLHHRVRVGTLLEIGAGFGTFCEEVRCLNLFQRIIALEMTPALAQTCRARDLEVVELPVEKLNLPPGSVDVMASFETIEHLFEPKAFLLACRRHLSCGGLLVLSCPNFEGFDISTLREKSNSVDHEHLNYFNPSSLRLLLEKCGFAVLEVITPGLLDADIVRNKVLAGEYDLSEQPFLHHILIDRWTEIGGEFQDFLAKNNLSSHLWIVSRCAARD